MPFLDWLPTYNVGHKNIDNQHREIVDMVNRLHNSILENRVNEEVARVLVDLMNYTKYHFDEEENVMYDNGYPLLKEHIKIHRDLINRIGGYLIKLRSGQKVSVFQLIGFLREWLVKHILDEDMRYKPYLPRNESSKNGYMTSTTGPDNSITNEPEADEVNPEKPPESNDSAKKADQETGIAETSAPVE